MLDQIKNLYNLRNQAEELRKQMAAEHFTAEVGLVTLTIDGNQELTDVQVRQGDAALIANDFKSAFASAQTQLKQALAKKFQGLV